METSVKIYGMEGEFLPDKIQVIIADDNKIQRHPVEYLNRAI